MVKLALHSIAYEAKTLNLAKAGYTAFYVDDTNGNDAHDGGSWGQAFKTIQHAVDEADSWCKIFIKGGTYAENVVIPDQGIHIIGEKIDTTIIKPSSGRAISSTGNNTTVETLTAVGNGTGSTNTAVYFGGEYSTAKNVIVGNQNTSGYGLVAAEEHCVCDGIRIDQSNKPNNGIWLESKYGTISNCTIEGVGQDGIVLAELTCYWNRVHYNTISDAGRYGVYLFGMGCDYNTILHNNIINSTTANARDTTGATNKFFENFYDDHTTDTDNDGICDSAYSFTTGTDYQPVSRRDGWKQKCLGTAAGYVDDVTFRKVTKSITISTGAIPNSEVLFWVTGDIECYVVGHVDSSVLSGGALTLSVGVSGSEDTLIPVTPKGNLLGGRVWVDATASSCRPSPARHAITNSSPISHYIEVAAPTAGALTYYCWWRPLSSNGNVVAS